MRIKDIKKLAVYRVYWRSGGSSVAAIGVCANGDRWIAPTNWVFPAVLTTKFARDIERVELLAEQGPQPHH